MRTVLFIFFALCMLLSCAMQSSALRKTDFSALYFFYDLFFQKSPITGSGSLVIDNLLFVATYPIDIFIVAPLYSALAVLFDLLIFIRDEVPSPEMIRFRDAGSINMALMYLVSHVLGHFFYYLRQLR
jgi:hypothetical protein